MCRAGSASPNRCRPSQLVQIRAVPGVSAVTYASWFGGPGQGQSYDLRLSDRPGQLFRDVSGIPIAQGQVDALAHTRTGRGDRHRHRGEIRLEDRRSHTAAVDIWTRRDGTSNWAFDVVGIYRNPGDSSQNNQIFINHEYFDEERVFGKNTYGWDIVQIGRCRPGTPDRHGDRPAVRQFPRRWTRTQTEKENTQSFLKQIGDYRFIATVDHRRGVSSRCVPDRQHHDAVDAERVAGIRGC